MKKDPQTKKKLLRSPLLWGVLTSLLLTGLALLLPDYSPTMAWRSSLRMARYKSSIR